MPKANTAAPATAAPLAMPVATASMGVPPGVPPPNIPSNHPDQFVSVGLANNFNGRALSLYYLARKIEAGKNAKEKSAKEGIYELAVEINIQADDESLGHNGIVTEYIKADVLTQWVPSRVDPVWVSVPGEGQYNGHWQYTPAGTIGGVQATLDMYELLALGKSGFPVFGQGGQPELNPDGTSKTAVLPPDDWKGWFVIPGKNNSRQGLMKGTKWNHFTSELERVGYRSKAPHINWGDFRQFLVGVYGTWTRMEFTFSGGAAPPRMPGQQGKIETLCLSSILDLGPISGNGGPVAVAAPPVPAAALTMQVPAPAAAVAPAAQAPAPAASASPLGGKDPALVSAAMDKMLAALVAAKVAVGQPGATQQEAATLVYNELGTQGLDQALGLRWMNDVQDGGWMVADERQFAYDQKTGMLLPLS